LPSLTCPPHSYGRRELLRKQAKAWLACWNHTASRQAGAWQSPWLDSNPTQCQMTKLKCQIKLQIPSKVKYQNAKSKMTEQNFKIAN
jgi:hypothetical protein